jgi:hypothetical protein
VVESSLQQEGISSNDFAGKKRIGKDLFRDLDAECGSCRAGAMGRSLETSAGARAVPVPWTAGAEGGSHEVDTGAEVDPVMMVQVPWAVHVARWAGAEGGPHEVGAGAGGQYM